MKPSTQPTACSLCIRHSRHEEFIAASLRLSQGQTINLGARSHHQMLLELARIRLRDRAAGVPLAEEGWIHRDELTTRLGVDEAYVNVMVHRVRHQLRKTGVSAAGDIVERRRGIGELRLGIASVSVTPL